MYLNQTQMTVYVQHFYSFYLYFCRSWVIMYSESAIERSKGMQSFLCVKPNSMAMYCLNGHSEMIYKHIVLQKFLKRLYSSSERVTLNYIFNTFYTDCPFLSMENARLFSLLVLYFIRWTLISFLFFCPFPWFLEWYASLDRTVLKHFTDKSRSSCQSYSRRFSLSCSHSKQMHFWCFLRTQLTAPDSLSAVWWHAAARANCLLLWKVSGVTEQCPPRRTTLLNGKAFLFGCFHYRWKHPIKIRVMKILDCASITACDPSMYHYQSTSCTSLNAFLSGRLCYIS